MTGHSRARPLIIVLVFVALLVVYARLIGHHWYRVTYATCERGAQLDLCGVWQREAAVEALIVLGLGAAAWLYFVRR
jgi:hypothetical protein